MFLSAEMVDGHLQYFTCFFSFSAALLFEILLYDLEAQSCEHVYHKKVGDTVELSSCLSSFENLTMAKWKYGGLIIADKNKDIDDEKQFKGRLKLDPTNFNLTVKDLTLKDAGDYHFISVGKSQNPTILVTLQVYESITKPPVLTGNSTWNPQTNSCTVLLECSSSEGNVSYNWTVGNQASDGSRLQHTIAAQGVKAEFTCIIYNPVSWMSASKTLECSRDTQQIVPQGPVNSLILIIVGGSILVIVIITGIAVICHCKKIKADNNTLDNTIYADITEVATEDGPTSTMKPCSVYETIQDKENQVRPEPLTIYDKIQLSRMRKPSVSPYQEVS
ncbi:signaling lymphocytic activation molecule-like isoform X1 [Xyrichtys novacula]|uniref:Signaling lymphocytic activation molecule-like isoform X1 n=1 Tax=Xyrichtys novacula TaxID=13765 RepID=A0AAV1HJF3_XYRNO|nr:signaling lymphocytic activation molecule-like isoform X1 [Xyrichtys novacula]